MFILSYLWSGGPSHSPVVAGSKHEWHPHINLLRNDYWDSRNSWHTGHPVTDISSRVGLRLCLIDWTASLQEKTKALCVDGTRLCNTLINSLPFISILRSCSYHAELTCEFIRSSFIRSFSRSSKAFHIIVTRQADRVLGVKFSKRR